MFLWCAASLRNAKILLWSSIRSCCIFFLCNGSIGLCVSLRVVSSWFSVCYMWRYFLWSVLFAVCGVSYDALLAFWWSTQFLHILFTVYQRPDVDGIIIWKCIVETGCEDVDWIRLNETRENCGFLLTRKWTFGFCKRPVIPWLAEWPSASQEGIE
jgi:hypothetical protein